ncbi:DUF2945 domain-containing protein [Streptomyces iranensis]|uniref:DUF2945 domain-containing protein n=1 Tax=Streptomyces iranensis TaxID=576784 RepID=UPI0005C9A6C2
MGPECRGGGALGGAVPRRGTGRKPPRWKSGVRPPTQERRRVTDRTEAAGRAVDASPDDPRYLVRSEKSGRTAVHKPSALEKK